MEDRISADKDVLLRGFKMAKQAKLKFRVGSACITGCRESQQDSYRFSPLNGARGNESANQCEELVAVVADGVGGAVSGDVASQLAVDNFIQVITQKFSKPTAETSLADALDTSNQSIKTAISENGQFAGMATTLVAAIVGASGLIWVSVGDSHLYIIRNKKLKKLNQDHSLGALVDKQYELGQISRQERDNTLYRNVILSCLSGEKIELIDMHANDFKLRKKDRLVLASDGLDTLTIKEIQDVSVKNKDSQSCADDLLKRVESKSKPHQDNATVLVIDCK